jgi:hypothetical protein
MMGEPENWPAEFAKNVQIRCFGGESHSRRCQRSFAVKAGPSQARAGKKMSDGFQSFSVPSCPSRISALPLRGQIRGF